MNEVIIPFVGNKGLVSSCIYDVKGPGQLVHSWSHYTICGQKIPWSARAFMKSLYHLWATKALVSSWIHKVIITLVETKALISSCILGVITTFVGNKGLGQLVHSGSHYIICGQQRTWLARAFTKSLYHLWATKALVSLCIHEVIIPFVGNKGLVSSCIYDVIIPFVGNKGSS